MNFIKKLINNDIKTSNIQRKVHNNIYLLIKLLDTNLSKRFYK